MAVTLFYPNITCVGAEEEDLECDDGFSSGYLVDSRHVNKKNDNGEEYSGTSTRLRSVVVPDRYTMNIHTVTCTCNALRTCLIHCR